MQDSDEIFVALENNELFRKNRLLIHRFLLEQRLGQDGVPLAEQTLAQIRHFVQFMLGSVESNPSLSLLFHGGECAEALAIHDSTPIDLRKRWRFRSALLYELAGAPAMAAAMLRRGDYTPVLDDAITRSGAFRSLGEWAPYTQDHLAPLALRALILESASLLSFEHGEGSDYEPRLAKLMIRLAAGFNLDLSASELLCFHKIIELRKSVSTRQNIADLGLFRQLQKIGFPLELWKVQVEALQQGLLDKSITGWGMAAPTGSGKSFLTRLLIIERCRHQDSGQIIYLVPSRALVHEVYTSLEKAFRDVGVSVVTITPQLVAPTMEENSKVESANVLVMTPEKADFLLRLGGDLFRRISTVIVDEAHHIEAGTRGILLEMYVWRIRRMVGGTTRFILLSAVTPNMPELVSWLGEKTAYVQSFQRATRMRLGVYDVFLESRRNRGFITYLDGAKVRVVDTVNSTNDRTKLLDLVFAVSAGGPVLTVAKGKKQCEDLASDAVRILISQSRIRYLSEQELNSPDIRRLDSRLEREMYSDVPLRNFLRCRIAYHHAGLPPRVRVAVEAAIKAGYIDLVFATTTLAEGVNFPFSTVVVQTLALRDPPTADRPARYSPISPRTFWNIAGRAGRPGFDKEGQVILFGPSLNLERVDGSLEDYTSTGVASLMPVESALANGIKLIKHSLSTGELSLEHLSSVTVSELRPEIAGTLNMLRVGVIHGRASGLTQTSDDLLDGSFAASRLSADDRAFARDLMTAQDAVVNSVLGLAEAPSLQLMAEVGLSLETIMSLREFVRSRDDWQLKQMRSLTFGGNVNLSIINYVILPVASRIAELEGRVLGAPLVQGVVSSWLSGEPFAVLHRDILAKKLRRYTRLEDVIGVLYSRIQYLLPWGLYAFDRLVEEEAKLRKIAYENQVRTIAWLSDAGVPNVDALKLVSFDFERVDATRLSYAYRRQHEFKDVVRWLASTPIPRLRVIIEGEDRRATDPDFNDQISAIRKALQAGTAGSR